MLNVCDVKVRGAYRLWLRFSDGFEGEIDLSHQLTGPVFQPLRDPSTFAAVRVDPENTYYRVAKRGGFRAGVPA